MSAVVPECRLVAQTGKDLPAEWETLAVSLGREDHWRRKWQPAPVFLPRESSGQRSLAHVVTENWT